MSREVEKILPSVSKQKVSANQIRDGAAGKAGKPFFTVVERKFVRSH